MITHVLTATLAAALSAVAPYGGPTYTGPPDTPTASALIYAGGGPKVYNAIRAYNVILGVQLLDPEIRFNLQRHYGVEAVDSWEHISSFVIRDAVEHSASSGKHVPLPPPALVGKALMTALINDGTGPNGVFWTGLWLDKLFSHAVHTSVVHDVDERFGASAYANFNRINNQAMYDIDHQIGGAVGLAPFH